MCFSRSEACLRNIKLRCEMCNKEFCKRYELRAHRTRKHGKKSKQLRVPCQHCEKTFLPSYIKTHLQVHLGDLKKCPHCSYASPFNRTLKFHISKKHTMQFTYTCDFCQCGFMEKCVLKEHIKKKHGDGICCTECGRSFHSEYYLKLHMEMHKPDYEMRNYGCDVCSKRFLSRKMLRQHLLKHSGLKKLYKCSFCGKELASNASLKAHTNIHTGLRPYVCAVCNNAFARRNYLVVHMRTHTQEKPYVCAGCGAAFTQKSSLTFHLRQLRSHGDEASLSFGCQDCGRRFSSNEILHQHLARGHGARLPCEICHKTFANSKNLRVHKESHALSFAQRSCHQCEMCGKRFSSKSNLLRHMKAHWGACIYQCRFCRKNLSSRTTLKDHEKIHTGEKLFVCHICGKCFSRRKYLNTHMNSKAHN